MSYPIRKVALFSVQLVVIQPFPLDLFTTTNNNSWLSMNRVCSSVQKCVLPLGLSIALFVCFCWANVFISYIIQRWKIKGERNACTFTHTRAQIMGYSQNALPFCQLHQIVLVLLRCRFPNLCEYSWEQVQSVFCQSSYFVRYVLRRPIVLNDRSADAVETGKCAELSRAW